MSRRTLLMVACAVFAPLLVSCAYWREGRLVGQWRSEASPERTLDLFQDRSYALRLSGRGLGFLSDLLGAEKGRWRVEGDTLVLVHTAAGGAERQERWPINELTADRVVLAGDRWLRGPR